jgi:hypothetical protein
MVRARSTTAPRTRRPTAEGRGTAAGEPALVQVAQQMVDHVEELLAEVESLRRDNQALQAELSATAAALERASDTLAAAASAGPRGRRRSAGTPARRRRERVTPRGVTTETVQSALADLGGEATAADIAAEITRRGTAVSGRAVRFLAERAGAQGVVGDDGQRRYRIG